MLISRRTTSVLLAVVFAFVMITAPAVPQDKSKPTMPGNFRMVAKTAYTVTLAWNPSSDNSGNFSYYLWGAYNVGPTVVLPKTATTYTFKALYPGNSYTFGIYARDAAGNASAQANLSGIVLPRDTMPPATAPAVAIREVGPNYAVLSWTPAQDDGPHLSTQIYLNGTFYDGVGRGITNATLRFLQPGTSYSLTLRAVDFSNNAGPFSSPVALTTPPPNPADFSPPSVPTNLYADHWDTEIQLNWTQSTDNFDAQAHIRYDIYVNGTLGDIRFGSGRPSIVYGGFGNNVIEVYATDTSGNTSQPAVMSLVLP